MQLSNNDAVFGTIDSVAELVRGINDEKGTSTGKEIDPLGPKAPASDQFASSQPVVPL